MEPIEPNSWIIFAVIMVLIIFASGCIIFCFVSIGRRNAINGTKYDEMYIYIAAMLVSPKLDLTSVNYDYIEKELTELGQMEYKDRYRTEKLSELFWTKFAVERMRRVIEDNNFSR